MPEADLRRGARRWVSASRPRCFAHDAGADRSSEVVGVLGAAGGIGVASILVAKAMGAKVVAIVHRTGPTNC